MDWFGCDNRTGAVIINCQFSRSKRVMKFIKRFVLHCLTQNIICIAKHVLEVNRVNYALSHFQFHSFWTLAPGAALHQMMVPEELRNLADKR